MSLGEVRERNVGCGGRQGKTGGVKKCGRVHGVECGKVRWGVGRGMGGVGKGKWGCIEVWEEVW